MNILDRLFTFTYFSGKGALENDLDAYISDFRIVKAYESHGKPRLKTHEYLQALKDGFVFCKWLNVNSNKMLVVKPSDYVIKKANQMYGYTIDSMAINKCVDGTLRFVISFGHIHQAIVGDLTAKGKSDFNQIIDDKYQHTISKFDDSITICIVFNGWHLRRGLKVDSPLALIKNQKLRQLIINEANKLYEQHKANK